jgi:hypothetical protein
MKKLALLISLLALIACRKESTEVPPAKDPYAQDVPVEELLAQLSPNEAIMRVDYYQVQCTGLSPQNCYLVQYNQEIGTDKWTYFYEDVEGFDYQKGFVYTLKVRVDKIENPPQDASDRKYVLLQVLSRKEAY